MLYPTFSVSDSWTLRAGGATAVDIGGAAQGPAGGGAAGSASRHAPFVRTTSR